MQTKNKICVKEIMNKRFPIMDSSLPLLTCIKKINKQEACLIIEKGNFTGILGYNDILRGFMYGKDKEAAIRDIKIKKRFRIVNPELDIYQTLVLMKRDNVDFLIVKDQGKFLGLITKKEIVDIEPSLFNNFTTKKL